MNGNPNQAQKDFQNDLREMGCIVTGQSNVELHHVFGSKWKVKGQVKPGEWIIIPLCVAEHADIEKYSFDAERGLFLAALRRYELEYGKPHPVPESLVDYYLGMRHRQDITRGNPIV